MGDWRRGEDEPGVIAAHGTIRCRRNAVIWQRSGRLTSLEVGYIHLESDSFDGAGKQMYFLVMSDDVLRGQR